MKMHHIPVNRSIVQTILVLTFIASGRSALAQCQQFVKPHVDYLKSHTSTATVSYKVHLVLVANAGIQLARYGTADLYLNPAGDSLIGNLTIYKSEKLTNPGKNPFDQYQTETKSMAISANSGVVRIGNSFMVSPQCSNLLLYGFTSPVSYVFYYYVISLIDKSETLPR